MNAFTSALKQHDLENSPFLCRDKLTTLQVNIGNLCNQRCAHCHIDASPEGQKVMSRDIMDKVLAFLSRYKMKTLDITGGAPELNPHFEYFVTQARGLVDDLIVRSNLTVLTEPLKKHLPQFYKKHKIHLICSLPCYLEQNVDKQRGSGVFGKSIAALKRLKALGYVRTSGLQMDLVYNPIGANLPPEQEQLEKDYKRILQEDYAVDFNRLITITNVPIKRFKTYLKQKGEYETYCDLLKDNFNPGVLNNIMCRTFISVGYEGRLYDCDFNQALGLALKDKDGQYLTIDRLDPVELEGREIIIGEHCLSCTAGSGSSCQGALETNEASEKDVKTSVREYYGKILGSKDDLKTSACCPVDAMPDFQKDILRRIAPEIKEKFYGCGSPIPPVLDGRTVLDLGCGTGRDVYTVSFLAGESGRAIGVDMTEEQLDVARRYQDEQRQAFGLKESNVLFKNGYIEDLTSAGVADQSVDVVISNCVINLSPEKKRVFEEIFRVLKQGGELYFADVFADRRLPAALRKDPVFYGECLGGALYIEDFRRILRDVGFPDYRVVTRKKIALNDKEMEAKAGAINFYSMVVRAFKLTSLEDLCEDYGQVAVYKGGIPYQENLFILDDHHIFEKNKPMLVCGNTAAMLSETRYASYFQVTGNRDTHFGRFDCSPLSISGREDGAVGGCC